MDTVTGFALVFIPGAMQPESVQLIIRSLRGLVPFGTMLVGAVTLTRFAPDETMHAEIRATLDGRRAGDSA